MSEQHIAAYLPVDHDRWMRYEVVIKPRIIHRAGDEEYKVLKVITREDGTVVKEVDYHKHTVNVYEQIFAWKGRGYRLRFNEIGCWELEEMRPSPEFGYMTMANRSRLSGPKAVHWDTWITSLFGSTYREELGELAKIIDNEIAEFMIKSS